MHEILLLVRSCVSSCARPVSLRRTFPRRQGGGDTEDEAVGEGQRRVHLKPSPACETTNLFAGQRESLPWWSRQKAVRSDAAAAAVCRTVARTRLNSCNSTSIRANQKYLTFMHAGRIGCSRPSWNGSCLVKQRTPRRRSSAVWFGLAWRTSRTALTAVAAVCIPVVSTEAAVSCYFVEW